MALARITKDPEVRRNEIIDTAGRLFIERGYDRTSMSDIIREMGVAQGTVYYYFKSKDDIFRAIIDLYFERVMAAVEPVAADGRLDALQKLQRVLDVMFGHRHGSKLDGVAEFVEKVSKHEKYNANINARLVPIVVGIVEQGTREGLFRIDYPADTMEFLVTILKNFHDTMGMMKEDERLRKNKALEALLEKALNVSPGAIRINF